MGISPAGGSDGGGGVTGGGYLRLPPPEHSHKVHCSQAHYGPVSGVGEASGVTGGQSVAGTGRIGLGMDADGGLGGGTDKGGRGDGRDGDGDGYGYGDGLTRWEDTVANGILGTEPNDTLAYDPGLELHHPIMSMIGGHRGRLDRERVL